jgi:hypothetical protein
MPAAVGTSTHQDCAKYEIIGKGLIHHLQERMSTKINHESHKFGDLEQLDRLTTPTIHQQRKNTESDAAAPDVFQGVPYQWIG